MASGLAVLISGSGTIMEALAGAGVPIDLVLADRLCVGLERAKQLGLKAELLERTHFGYSHQLVDRLQSHGIKKVALAGWMTIFTEPMLAAYEGQILNTHPSLLPAFAGGHAVRDALEYGVKWTGYSCHVVTLELDAGPIVDQYPVEVRADDTEESLHERIKAAERERYPKVIKRWLAGELALDGDAVR